MLDFRIHSHAISKTIGVANPAKNERQRADLWDLPLRRLRLRLRHQRRLITIHHDDPVDTLFRIFFKGQVAGRFFTSGLLGKGLMVSLTRVGLMLFQVE